MFEKKGLMWLAKRITYSFEDIFLWMDGPWWWWSCGQRARHLGTLTCQKIASMYDYRIVSTFHCRVLIRLATCMLHSELSLEMKEG